MNRKRPASIMAWPFMAICLLSVGQAAPINYGDFSDIPPGSVMYLDVTESANSPGDPEPLFGSPTITANTLRFIPTVNFAASSASGSADQTEGQLAFGLGGDNAAITQLQIAGTGRYDLAGMSGSAHVGYRSRIAQLNVLEVDGAPVSSPIVLPVLELSGAFDLANGKSNGNLWTGTATYDINAALAAAAVNFDVGATKLDVVVSHLVEAQADTTAMAHIENRGFEIAAETVAVPEPSGWVFVGLLPGMGLMLRRR